MTSELDIFAKLKQINDSEETLKYVSIFPYTDEHAMMVSKHRAIQRLSRPERPSTATTYRVGIYIRYFNQTKHENYLDYHIKQYQDTLALCPNWTLVDFYIDEGATAPNMETAKEWSRCLNDAIDGKFDLIITQKVSNISKKPYEVTLCSRLLATQKHPIGIYFVSEDIFTLASYYKRDLKDTCFFPSDDWELLPDDESEPKGQIE